MERCGAYPTSKAAGARITENGGAVREEKLLTQALFHVLVGARMPSVLVEMFFISNRIEARAMAEESHQDALVESLYEGIQKFGRTNLMVSEIASGGVVGGFLLQRRGKTCSRMC